VPAILQTQYFVTGVISGVGGASESSWPSKAGELEWPVQLRHRRHVGSTWSMSG
jgi:hypothetical protein